MYTVKFYQSKYIIMKIETKEFTRKAKDYDMWDDGIVRPYYYDSLVFQLFRYYYERESDCFAPRVGLAVFSTCIFGRHRSFLGFNLSGFRKSNEPNHLRASLSIDLLYREFNFNIGLADKGWFYIRWIEGYSFFENLYRKITNKDGF